MNTPSSTPAHTLAIDEKGVIVPCSGCGQRNRLPYERVHQAARCSKCQATLHAPDTPIDVSDDASFGAAVSRSSLPVLVDFWAGWCGPCKMMAPEFAVAARAGAGQWLSLKVDTDSLQTVAATHQVQALPTLAVFKKGQEVRREMGARPAAGIGQLVQSVL